jgi:hypothetical protein
LQNFERGALGKRRPLIGLYSGYATLIDPCCDYARHFRPRTEHHIGGSILEQNESVLSSDPRTPLRIYQADSPRLINGYAGSVSAYYPIRHRGKPDRHSCLNIRPRSVKTSGKPNTPMDIEHTAKVRPTVCDRVNNIEIGEPQSRQKTAPRGVCSSIKAIAFPRIPSDLPQPIKLLNREGPIPVT